MDEHHDVAEVKESLRLLHTCTPHGHLAYEVKISPRPSEALDLGLILLYSVRYMA